MKTQVKVNDHDLNAPKNAFSYFEILLLLHHCYYRPTINCLLFLKFH